MLWREDFFECVRGYIFWMNTVLHNLSVKYSTCQLVNFRKYMLPISKRESNGALLSERCMFLLEEKCTI